MGGPLKTATAIVGLLAGIVTGLYLLGGLVIGLRLLFDHFEFSAVASTLGQLPREPVIATALIDVIAPTALIGLALTLLYGLLGSPRPQPGANPDLSTVRWPGLLFAGLALLALLLAVPAPGSRTSTKARCRCCGCWSGRCSPSPSWSPAGT